MSARLAVATVTLLWLGTSAAQGQTAPAPTVPSTSPPTVGGWQRPDARTARAPADIDRNTNSSTTSQPTGGVANPLEPLKPLTTSPRKPIARVTQQGAVTLANEAGQVWREYDLSTYTVRVTSTNRPEQAIVDWILRETGYEAWHSEPLGILSASPRSLKVYHTPDMQALVSEVVDRFVSSEAESQAFELRVATVGNPAWRVKAQPMMRPVAVQTQGIQAWLMQREDAALLLAEMRRRTDFREHSSPHLVVNNGQSTTVPVIRPRTYIRDIILQPQAWPAFQPEMGQFDEGFSLELNPLLSLDGRSVDAVIKCNIDQLEKLVPVMLEVPTPTAPRQRTKIEVPQVSQFRLHERFRWPVDQVLVVGMGIVPTPVPADPNRLVASIPLLNDAPRADLLVFVESKGRLTPGAAVAAPTGVPQPGVAPTALQPPRDLGKYRGRY